MRGYWLLCWSIALGGCAGSGASGREWVRAPEPGPFEGELAQLEGGSGPLELTAAPPPTRPRLRQTITLGETIVPPASEPPATPSAPGPTVVVTVQNQLVAPPPTVYAADFVPVAVPVPRAVQRRPTTSVPPLGGDWPAPRDSGPAFPYKTAPASPWNGQR